ncbi:protein adenylyltransferase SelO family protein, partial [Burkholderia multivorans]
MSFSRSAADPADTLPDLAATLAAPDTHAFLRLGDAFHTRLPAAPLAAPYVVGFSDEVARLLGLPASLAAQPGFAELFAGNPTRDWPAEALPYASVYSGHQFGVWAGQLGDGRALTIGELPGTDGRRYELQLKG